MTKIDVYTAKGTKKSSLTLPKEFEAEVNLRLIAQALRVYESAGHTGLRKTKTRGEINRTTKKLYKQKGTGGARHGSRRAPIFVGGGIAHGPRPLKRVLSLPKGIKRKAFSSALAIKIEEGLVVALSGISTLKKTNEFKGLVKTLAEEFKAKKFSFVLADKNKETLKLTKNLGNSTTYFYKDLNAHNVFYGGVIILDEEIFEKYKSAKKEMKPVAKKATKKVNKK